MNSSDLTNAEGRVSPPVLDRLLSKYVGVWLWSVIFATTTGLLFSFLHFDTDRWNTLLSLALAIPAASSVIAIFASLLQLYSALQRCLIPQFLLSTAASEGDGVQLGRYLKGACSYFIIAATFRAMVGVFDMLLVSLRY